MKPSGAINYCSGICVYSFIICQFIVVCLQSRLGSFICLKFIHFFIFVFSFSYCFLTIICISLSFMILSEPPFLKQISLRLVGFVLFFIKILIVSLLLFPLFVWLLSILIFLVPFSANLGGWFFLLTPFVSHQNIRGLSCFPIGAHIITSPLYAGLKIKPRIGKFSALDPQSRISLRKFIKFTWCQYALLLKHVHVDIKKRQDVCKSKTQTCYINRSDFYSSFSTPGYSLNDIP